MKQLRLALQGKSGTDLKSEENKLKLVALKVTTTINTLIKVCKSLNIVMVAVLSVVILQGFLFPQSFENVVMG